MMEVKSTIDGHPPPPNGGGLHSECSSAIEASLHSLVRLPSFGHRALQIASYPSPSLRTGSLGDQDEREEIAVYLSGVKLYGDNFSENEIAKWYAEEAEGYADLRASDRDSYCYDYHALNKQLGFAHLGKATFEHALGIGSAYGDEFLPIITKIKRITILDPSDAFVVDHIEGVAVTYRKPTPSGDLPFVTNSLNLIMCFGVLHHIPNVTHIMQEMGRCLIPGGFVLIREPTVSMGNWTRPRAGLTKRERGIPHKIMASAIACARLEVISARPFGFSPLVYGWNRMLRSSMYNSGIAVWLDILFSRLTAWNHRYHRQGLLQRFAPSSAFWVLTKKASGGI